MKLLEQALYRARGVAVANPGVKADRSIFVSLSERSAARTVAIQAATYLH
jgi:hypothetical protein